MNDFRPTTEIKSISIPILSSSNFLSLDTKKEKKNDPDTKTNSFSITQKLSHSDPYTEIKSISISTLNLIQFCCLDTKNKFISIQRLKPCYFRPPHKNQVNSDPYTEIKSISIPHTEIKSISTTHATTKSISMSTLNSCHFRPVLFCVLYIRAHVPAIQQQYVSNKYEYQLVLFLTCPYYSKTLKIFRKYMLYAIFDILLHGIYMTTYDTGGRTSLRSIPPIRSIS